MLYTDASKKGLGAVLSQKKEGREYVIAYASRSTNKTEENYPITDLECLAIVWAIKHFHHYLSRPFTIVTDHAALKWLKTSKMPKGRRARWIMELQQHHFTIEHRAGKHNANADALSRMYDEETAECFMVNFSEESDKADDENDEWYENELAKQYANVPLITAVGYQSPKNELEEIYRENIKIKQVIAGQPITKGGSQCTYSCDTENHHIHTYCKACKKNLLYGTITHDCIIGFGLGKIQPDMKPEYLVNDLWWDEPILVQHENLRVLLQTHLGNSNLNASSFSPSSY
jgi:hypothetical protein